MGWAMCVKRVLCTALLSAGLFSALSAQPAGPQGSSENPLLQVLVTNSEGRWDPDQQARFRPPLSLGEAEVVSTDWKVLLQTDPLKILSYQEKIRLLEHPHRLLASTWADQYFSSRHVMVLAPEEDGRVVGRLYDNQTGREEPLVVSGRSGADRARGDAVGDAAAIAELSTVPVAAHPESGLYHAQDAPHLSPRVVYTEIPTAQRAEIYGFEACRICYPQTDRSTLYDTIDHRLGEMVAANIESRYRLAPDGPQTERVDRIGRRLLQQNRFLDQGYRFLVLDSDTINAFAAPTGPIYVTTGLLEILESDDELAAILGHELSHSERRHARQQYERAREAGVVGLLVTVATGIPWARLGSDVLATVLVRGYSRGYELEADRDGMMTAYAAGYVPHDFLLVQEKLRQVSEQRGGGGAGWLRTHPRGEDRLEQLKSILSETEEVRVRLDALEQQDPGMAQYLKGRVLDPKGDTVELEEYITLYERVLPRVKMEEPPVPVAQPEPNLEAPTPLPEETP